MPLGRLSRSVTVLAIVLAGCASADDPIQATGASVGDSTAAGATTTAAAQPSAADAASVTPASLPFDAAVGPEPVGFVKITNGEGGFAGDVGPADRFGRDHDSAGDIDGDGILDLVVGARSDDDGPTGADTLTDAGAVYILFMNEDGTVRSNQKISSLSGGFEEPLAEGSFFGYGVAGIGDYDGDGIPDVAASAPSSLRFGDDAFEPTIYILHLNRDGTVKSVVESPGISSEGLSAVGDLDGDGRIDLVAADPNADSGGRVRILFFAADSTLRTDDVVVIGAGEGGFSGELSAGDSFGGRESAMLGDIDGDGSLELAVGAFMSDGGYGAVWILSLDAQTYEVLDQAKLAPGVAGFDEDLPTTENPNGSSGGQFGHALVAPGDLDGDGVPDLITSANQHEAGVVYIVYLNADKTVKDFSRINNDEGGFDLSLDAEERFGRSMSVVHRDDATMTVNVGGGAAARLGGAIYALDFDLVPSTIDSLLLCGGLEVTVDLAAGQSPTEGADVIRGTADADEIDGLGGNDVICSLQGDDIIDAGDGFDTVFGGAGDDEISGGVGNDMLVGGAGADSISGGNGNDRLQGGTDGDLLEGDGGFDIVRGGDGDDTIRGGTHDDLLWGNLGRDDISGDGGDDTLRGGAWLDTMDGGNGADGCTLTDPSGITEVRVNCETGVYLS